MSVNSFAEKRKKTLEARNMTGKDSSGNTGAASVPDPNFRERRIQKLNVKKKMDNRFDTNMWNTENLMERSVKSYAENLKNREKWIEDNQKRASMTDFRRKEREEIQKEKRTPGNYLTMNLESERVPYSAGFQGKDGKQKEKNLIDLSIENKNKKRNQEQRDRIGITEKGIFKEGLERFTPYSELEKRNDFAEYAARGDQMEGNPIANNPETAMKGLWKNPWKSIKRNNHTFQKMNQSEKNIYNYLYSRYGADQADKYANSLDETLNIRAGMDAYGLMKDVKEENALAGMAGNLMLSAGSGAERAVSGALQIGNALMGNPVPDETTALEAYAGKLHEDTRGVERAVYDMAGSLGFMLPSMLASPAIGTTAASTMFGVSLAGGSYNDAMREGKDVTAAQGYAIVNGVSEAVTQYFLGGIHGLGKGAAKKLIGNTGAAKAAEKALGRLAKDPALRNALYQIGNYGADMVSEGAQEYTQELLDKAARNIIFGENNEIRLSDPDAWYAAMLGAMNAGVLNAPGAIGYELELRDYGKMLNPDYRVYVESIDTDRNSYQTEQGYQEAVDLKELAMRYAERQRNGEFISNREKAIYDERASRLYWNKLQQEQEIAPAQNGIETGTDQQEMNQDVPEHMEENKVIQESQKAELPKNQEEIGELPTRQENGQETVNKLPEAYNALRDKTQGLGDEYGKNGKNAYLDNYDEDMDLVAYSRAFGRAYDAGRYAVDMDTAEHAAVMSVLNSQQMENAFAAGAKDRLLDNRVDQETGEQLGLKLGEPKQGGVILKTDQATNAQKKVADHIGKLTGLQIELVDGMGQEGVAASYGKGKITLDINSRDYMGDASHELTHFIKDYSADMYRSYRDTAVKAMMKSQNVSMDKLVESYTQRYEKAGKKLSRDEAVDEIVADATQKFFNDEEFIREVAKKDAGVGQKIIDFITDIIDALKELIKTGSTRKSALALEENMVYFKRARRYWMQGLEEAGVRYKSGQELETDAENYKLENPEEISGKQLEQNFDYVRRMEPITTLKGNEFEGKRGVKALTEAVLELYESHGNMVHNDVVGDIMLSRRSVKDDIAHGYNEVKAITFKAVPEVLKNGKVLSYQKNWKERGYDTAVIGGKINIAEGKNAGDYYQICVLKVTDDHNRMYLHEVQTMKKDGDIPFKTWTVKENGLPSGYAPSIYSIFEKLGEVNDNQMEHGIRFKLEDVDDYQSDTDALLRENQELREANELLKKQFELTSKEEMRQEDILKISKKVIKDYESSMKPEMLAQNLTRLYEYIRSIDKVDSQELSEVAADIARSVLNKATRKDTALYDQYKDVRKQIRDTKIMIADQDKQDLAAMGGYNTFRKKYFGKMKLGNDGISVDALYQELSGQHPELFSEEITHPADQLMQIGAVLDMTQPMVQNPYHANMDEMSYIVGQEILAEYANVRNIAPTFADRKQAELMQVKKEYQKKTKAYREKLVSQYKEAMEKAKDEAAYNAQWRDAEVAFQQEKFDRRIKKQKAKKAIMKDANQLTNWLLKPTDSKHIPQELRSTVAEFLSSIDLSSNYDTPEIITKRTEAWNNAEKAFRKIIDNEGMFVDADRNTVYTNIDPDMAKRIEEITKKVKGIDKLENLDTNDLEELQKTVVAMKKALMEANQLKSNKKSGEVSVIAEGVMGTAAKRKNRAEFGKAIGSLDQLLSYDILDANTMFGIMGEDMKSLYQAIRDGQDTKTRKLQIAKAYIDDVMEKNGVTGSEIRKWQSEESVKEFRTVRGETVRMSIAQIMSLYELNKRKQAKGHIYSEKGGIKPGERTGKFGRIEKAYSPVRVTAEDVEKIVGTLTEQQIAIADDLQKFMGKECSEWGNEVTMELYGYYKFTAMDYFPIKTDDKYIGMRDQDLTGPANESTIKNMGITKPTIEHANNPVIIDDIFSVFKGQVDKMSAYNAYVIPLSDLQKVYNYKDARNSFGGSTLKQEIDRAYGKRANAYIHQFLVDVNGTSNTDKAFSEGLIGNMKAAAVAGNIRVAIQQPTAYIRAMDEMDAKYLIMGAASFTRKGQWQEICKYAPVAQWKDWGFVRSEVGPQLETVLFENGSKKEWLVDKTSYLAQKGDQITWNHLWRAVEYETMDLHPELEPGSEAFKQYVGQRFSQIIDNTQVADSVIARTQISRSSNKLNQMASSFMSEPLKTCNMLYRAAWDVKNKEPGAKRKATRTAAVFVLNSLATALAASVIDATRDKDKDKKWNDRYVGYVKDDFKDNVFLPNMVPYMKDIVSTFQGYTVARSDMSWAQNMKYAANWIAKLQRGESQYTPGYVMAYTLRMSSSMIGVPMNSILRDLEAVIDEVAAVNTRTEYSNAKLKYAIDSKDNLKMYARMIVEAGDSGNTKLAETIWNDLLNAGWTEKDISDKINSIMNTEIKNTVDIIGAAEKYSVTDKESQKYFEEQVEKYIELKKKAGWDEEKCLKQIRSMLNEKYKPIWQQAKTLKEKEEIRKKCVQLYYKGDSIYAGYNFNNWKE